MKNDPLHQQLREFAWRRKLSRDEEAKLKIWLAEHPQAEAEWESEANLTEALGRLPDPPVASNFTARVLQAVDREKNAARSRSGWLSWLTIWPVRWLPRVALATVVVTAGLLSYHALEDQRRLKRANSLRLVSQVDSMPSPRILEDFDAIQAMSQAPPPDEELLKLLQ